MTAVLPGGGLAGGGSVGAAWAQPRGLAAISAVNHTNVGRRFVVTGFVFFLLAGLLGLLVRAQLTLPGLELLSPDAYNQVFTMHGVTMMFLFAVPIIEGAGIYLLPLMLGARDLPFPRLGALGYWCYLFGGGLLFGSLFFGAAPDGGWFIYPPLTGSHYSPGINIDVWLLAITFIEISALAAAVEIVIGILRNRTPGMRIDRMPIFGWYMLVTALMIVFGFPPLIMGSVLLELERAFDFPFYEAARGGDALLWQHLFWLFGHPEVYIVFLPAAGVISTILPTFVGKPLFGYAWLVVAAIATGFLSFALWVHHMYAVGIPALSLAFFSAASMLVAVPSGIQVFAWIATLWQGRPRLATPMLFALGFLFLFTLGGITGVMVAVVPFDLQVHDTYFVVAHFHYVLIGGVVFPMFAALYYWFPLDTGRMLDERLGHWNFWLMFIGINLAFFPMHVLGFLGMPRRIFTYPEGLGWTAHNVAASIGAAIFAAGVLLFLINVVVSLRRGTPAGRNPWNAPTLEWASADFAYNFASLPHVTSREPLWQEPDLPERIARGEGALAHAPHGRQETLVTSIVDARPLHVSVLPRPSWMPLLTACAIGMFFGGFLATTYGIAALGVALTVVMVVAWLWPGPEQRREWQTNVGGGQTLPLGHRLNDATPWSGGVLWVAIDATLYLSLLFSFLYLWVFAPAWPPAGLAAPPAMPLLLAAAALALAGVGLDRGQAAIRRDFGHLGIGGLALALIALLVSAGFWVWAMIGFGAAPQIHAYAAMVHTLIGFVLLHQGIAVLLGICAIVLWLQGALDRQRHLAMRLAVLLGHFAVVTGVVSALVLVFLPAGAWTP